MEPVTSGEFDCPRCGHSIPNDGEPGAFMGALSRADGMTEVCSACGRHEAFLGYRRGAPVEEDWPVEVPSEFYR